MIFLTLMAVLSAISLGCWINSTSDAAGFAIIKDLVCLIGCISLIAYNYYK